MVPDEAGMSPLFLHGRAPIVACGSAVDYAGSVVGVVPA